MQQNSFKKNLQGYAPQFILVLLVIQPLMDVLSYWLNEWERSNAPTLLLRMGVLGISALWGFFLSDKKKIYWIAAGIIAAVYAGHIFACAQVGFSDIVGDLSNYIRIVQMPVLVLVFSTCLKQNEKCFRHLFTGGSIAVGLVLGIELLSLATGTNPGTYTDGTGILGWFHNTNSQSAVICTLVPILLCWLMNQKKNPIWLFSLAAVLGCGALYFLGTRLAYAAIFAITLGFAVVILIACRKRWKNAVALALVALLFLGLYPLSPMAVHQKNYEKVQQDRQESTDNSLEKPNAPVTPPADAPVETPSEPVVETPSEPVVETPSEPPAETPAEPPAEPLTEQELLVQQLTPIYEKYVGDLVKIFGAEETMELYDYTTDAFEFSDVRKKKLLVAEYLMDHSPISTRFFGVELSRFTINNNIYDVENDFHGIFYLYGGVGLACYLLFIGYFLFLIAYALIKNFKKYFTVEAGAVGIALALCLIHAIFTAGVLRRPNASVYLSMALAAVYYLVCVRRYDTMK